MLFGEKSITAHTYLFIAGLILLSFFLGYVFLSKHKSSISSSSIWTKIFTQIRLDNKINNISHDYSMWYYNGESTCVGYGDFSDKCHSYENICSGDENMIYGTPFEQATNVKIAINNGGVHPDCPLVYQGTD